MGRGTPLRAASSPPPRNEADEEPPELGYVMAPKLPGPIDISDANVGNVLEAVKQLTVGDNYQFTFTAEGFTSIFCGHLVSFCCWDEHGALLLCDVDAASSAIISARPGDLIAAGICRPHDCGQFTLPVDYNDPYSFQIVEMPQTEIPSIFNALVHGSVHPRYLRHPDDVPDRRSVTPPAPTGETAAELRDALDRTRKRMTELSDMADQAKVTVSRLRGERNELRDKVFSLEEQLASRPVPGGGLERTLDEVHGELDRVRHQLIAAERANKTLKAEQQRANKEHDELMENLRMDARKAEATSRRERDTALNTAARLEGDLAEKGRQAADLADRLRRAQADHDSAAERAADEIRAAQSATRAAESRAQTLARDNESLQARNTALESSMPRPLPMAPGAAAATVPESEYRRVQDVLKTAQRELASLTTARTEEQQQHADALRAERTRTATATRHAEEADALRTTAEQQAARAAAAAAREAARFRDEIATLSETMEAEKRAATQKLKAADAARVTLQGEFDELLTRFDALTAANRRLEAAVASAKQDAADADAALKVVQTAKPRAAAAVAAPDPLETATLHAEIDSLRDTNARLRREAASAVTDHANALAAVQTQLDGAKRDLRAARTVPAAAPAAPDAARRVRELSDERDALIARVAELEAAYTALAAARHVHVVDDAASSAGNTESSDSQSSLFDPVDSMAVGSAGVSLNELRQTVVATHIRDVYTRQQQGAQLSTADIQLLAATASQQLTVKSVATPDFWALSSWPQLLQNAAVAAMTPTTGYFDRVKILENGLRESPEGIELLRSNLPRYSLVKDLIAAFSATRLLTDTAAEPLARVTQFVLSVIQGETRGLTLAKIDKITAPSSKGMTVADKIRQQGSSSATRSKSAGSPKNRGQKSSGKGAETSPKDSKSQPRGNGGGGTQSA